MEAIMQKWTDSEIKKRRENPSPDELSDVIDHYLAAEDTDHLEYTNFVRVLMDTSVACEIQ